MLLGARYTALLAVGLLGTCGGEMPGEPDDDAATPYDAATPAVMMTVFVLHENPADERVQATREAVDFWNGVFADLDLRQPFDTVTFVQSQIPEDILAAYSRAVLEGAPRPSQPNYYTRIGADVVIALSDLEIISFATGLESPDHHLVGIRTDRTPPLSLPNVSRNLVAHELGHVLGLGHNSDPTKLMCGRPASCRPGAFESSVPHFFELTESERAQLVQLHGQNP